jgi:protein-S-isoprenylcysteine O-methyltransferase Ste14
VAHEPHGWTWIFRVAAATFVALAATVSLSGPLAFERGIYETIVTALPDTTIFRWVTRLGSPTTLVPALLFLIIVLPRQFFRRWWMWVAVMLVTSTLEGISKEIVGRPRPEALRPGFPSSHTAAAAAFYLMAAYFAAVVLKRRWVTYVVYGLASCLVLLVALSRIVLRLHWPFDVLAGAALGIAVVAAAASWHEQHPVTRGWQPVSVPFAAQQWLYRWQAVIPISLFAVLFLTPPIAAEDSALDVIFDVSGGGFVVGGLLLRLWVVAHAGKQSAFPHLVPTKLVMTGPYAYMRHPLSLGNLLIGIGIMLFAESGPGLVLIPTMMILMFRVTIPFEEARLSERFGGRYAEYCGRVPRFPRLTPAMSSGEVHVPSWRSLTQELPAVATTLVCAVLAEASEFVPRLLR